MRKRILLLGLLAFLLISNQVQADESGKELVILYNGDTLGYVEGCG